ncbi:unnamed protein product, partial [Mesorhabditis spiculigera]
MGSRRHRRSKVIRVVNLVKRIIAFFFSHVGLCALVVGYSSLGAFIFRAVEGPHELRIQNQVAAERKKTIDIAWNATFRVNRLNEEQWKRIVHTQVNSFRATCYNAIRNGYDGKMFTPQWTLPGAFMYSLTIITTIGYGNTSAKTPFGKVLTIMYAIIGIPLMLLFLTNIGDVLAKIFRFLYAQSIRLKFKIILWHKKRKAAKIRRANSLVSRLTRGHRVKADSSVDSLGHNGYIGGPDVEDLLTAQAQMEELEVKEIVQQQLDKITVPLSLVCLTMLAYLMLGTMIFHFWEGWELIDSFYFCYISLTTIGFGDKFPGESLSDKEDARNKLVITSIYLLFGMALLAMCFNLAQEEVANKTRWLASKFRRQKSEDDD